MRSKRNSENIPEEPASRSLRSGRSLPSQDTTPAKKRVKISDTSNTLKTPVIIKEIAASSPAVLKTPIQAAFQEAKSAFRRCATPARLVGRAEERRVIQEFWAESVEAEAAGSLYISGNGLFYNAHDFIGVPGTGKTALLNEIMKEKKLEPRKVRVFSVNCMSLKEPKQIFSLMASEFSSGKGKEAIIKPDRGM
jgi:cell division control protein 6